MIQTSLFSPGSGGLEQLITRRDDPPTSKAAAHKAYKNRNGETSFSEFAYLLETYGDMTCKEAASHMEDKSFWAFEFNRRVKQWHVAGHIELTGEERDGSRVWRIAK